MSKFFRFGFSFLTLIAVVLAGVKLYISDIAEENVRAALSQMDGSVDIAYEDVSIDLLGMDLRISGLTVTPKGSGRPVQIDDLVFHDIDPKSEIPSYMSVSLSGLKLDVSTLGSYGSLLSGLGYAGTLTADLKVDYHYDPEKKTLDVREIALDCEDAGELVLRFTVSNIDINRDELPLLLFTFPQVVLNHVEIDFDDDSLVDRIIRKAARDNKVDPEQFKASLVKVLDDAIAEEQDDLVKSALAGTRGFLNKPRGVNLSASPAEPSPLGRILDAKNPQEIIKLLNLKVRS